MIRATAIGKRRRRRSRKEESSFFFFFFFSPLDDALARAVAMTTGKLYTSLQHCSRRAT